MVLFGALHARTCQQLPTCLADTLWLVNEWISFLDSLTALELLFVSCAPGQAVLHWAPWEPLLLQVPTSSVGFPFLLCGPSVICCRQAVQSALTPLQEEWLCMALHI